MDLHASIGVPFMDRHNSNYAKNQDICIIANLWLIMSRNIIGTNPLP